MKRLLLTLLVLACYPSFAQEGDPNLLEIRKVYASDTDSDITNAHDDWYRNYIFYNPDATPTDKIMLYIPGSIDNPLNTEKFPSLAANNGIPTISLVYENDDTGQDACGGSADNNCHYKWRKEIIEGVDYSTEIAVDFDYSIENRFVRMLQYLHTTYPTEGWDSYYGGDIINWTNIIVAGHSQGGSHAALIAKEHNVERALCFASPNDYTNTNNSVADWTSINSATSDSNFYFFGNLYDEVPDGFAIQYENMDSINAELYGDTVLVDNSNCPYSNSRLLYTKIDGGIGLVANHNSPVRDSHTPVEIDGSATYEPVWRYMLGLGCSTTGLEDEEIDMISLYPNPATQQINFNSLRNENYQIFDSSGKVVSNGKVKVGLNEIELDHLTNGFYFFKTTSNIEGIKFTIDK